ncbi:MAG: efflux RND transporter periplasmic adaptor subunit [Candidatus Omnitrophica bacterium]|nr:efflux RND transporter periplasmic adaptor subunit [Candidatus Omnitrophota bacterium]MBU1807957.1 efflux RND transporter periplasmic adaptor subunit [Candidatus Omnitrophota bacterium]
MKSAGKKSILFLSIIAVSLLSVCIFLEGCGKEAPRSTAEQDKGVAYWTCAMHPSVRISDEQYKKGTTNCPICNMALFAVSAVTEPEVAPPVDGSQVTGDAYYGCGVTEEGHCPHCDEGIPDAECICGGHSFVLGSGKLTSCPICKKPLKKIDPKDLPGRIRPVELSGKSVPRKILHYRNPMDPKVTSSVPAKDSMGMDYIPVYEEDVASTGGGEILSRLKLSQEQVALAGIKTTVVGRQRLYESIRVVGMVAYDPELAVTQEEFLTAVETRQKVKDSSDADVIRRADDLIEKSRFKLRLMGMGDDEISELQKNGKSQLNLVLPEDKAWIYADIYEADLGWVKPGQEATITVAAYPGEEFNGTVKSISPVLDQKTRSARVRIETDNIGRKLKPKMYADVLIKSVYLPQDGSVEVLAVPTGAVLDTGVRKIVYVVGDGEFLGKEVITGPKGAAMIDGKNVQMYPILGGLSEGEAVVTEGNFLIDSQSQISGVAAVAYGGALGKE